MTLVNRQTYREAMARFGAAVSVVTTDGPAGRFGFTASAVCSVTDDPPTLLVCINRKNDSHPALLANGVLCVNTLAAGQEEISGVFGGGSAAQDARFGAGESLMTRGEPSDSAYVIIEGEVEVLGETPKGEFVIGVLGQNALLGEMGIITNAPRGTTVRAKGPVRALRIAGDVFLRLLTDNPGCALHVMRELSGRVNMGNARLAAALRDVEALKVKVRAATEPATNEQAANAQPSGAAN